MNYRGHLCGEKARKIPINFGNRIRISRMIVTCQMLYRPDHRSSLDEFHTLIISIYFNIFSCFYGFSSHLKCLTSLTRQLFHKKETKKCSQNLIKIEWLESNFILLLSYILYNLYYLIAVVVVLVVLLVLI